MWLSFVVLCWFTEIELNLYVTNDKSSNYGFRLYTKSYIEYDNSKPATTYIITAIYVAELLAGATYIAR